MSNKRTTTTTTSSSLKNTSKSTQKNQMIISQKPFRKCRTKIKKPKFLSLQLELSNTQMLPKNNNNNNNQKNQRQQQQLNLFPLHPEHHHDHHNIDHIFAVDDEGPTTLTGLLNSTVTSTTTTTTSDGGGEGLTCAYEASLVRTALRNRERDSSCAEKWVSMTEVVAASAAEEEVTSEFPAAEQRRRVAGGEGEGDGGLLLLKLDYEEVLNAWSGKGPLYVEAEEPQIVPDLYFDDVIAHHLDVRNKGQWRVPEHKFDVENSASVEEAGGDFSAWKMGLREASVLRYKEKRQSRLFSKRIRYEVRKLNAQKRPRIKGRFVKRCVD